MKKKVLCIAAFALSILAVSVIGLNAAPRRLAVGEVLKADDSVNNKALYTNGTIYCCKPLNSYNCGAADCD